MVSQKNGNPTFSLSVFQDFWEPSEFVFPELRAWAELRSSGYLGAPMRQQEKINSFDELRSSSKELIFSCCRIGAPDPGPDAATGEDQLFR